MTDGREPTRRVVVVADGVALRVLDTPGDGRAFVLVHGLASNARLWDGVAGHLAAAGHRVVAADLRGHGRSDAPATGHDTATAAADLARLCRVLDLNAPVLVGQSWGANVVLRLATEYDGVRAVGCVDGGWIHLADRFRTWADCLAALSPPVFNGVTMSAFEQRLRRRHPDWSDAAIAGTMANLSTGPDGSVRARLAREHHLSILRSLWEDRPRERYARVDVPVLLLPAGGPDDPGRALVTEAASALPRARVRWYPGADHDLHAQHPDQVAVDLRTLT
ncbi:alpha/beta fold hydrolase [soil metagenome]